MRSILLDERLYKRIIFDCDGVLLDSNDLKVSAFRSTASSADFDEATIRNFSSWQSRNFGTSRYRAFERLMSGEYGPVPPTARLENLLATFGSIVRSGYEQVAEAPGLRPLLTQLSGIPLYVASGSDEAELRDVLEKRGLASFFTEIRGSPTPKTQIVEQILASNPAERTVFVGDAHADADAANNNAIDFVFVSSMSTVRESMLERARVEGFVTLETLEDFSRAANFAG